MMKRGLFCFVGLCVAVVLTAQPVRAGSQNGSNLDQLFEALKTAEGARQALLVESRIWKAWLLAGSAAVDAEMARGVDLMNAGELSAALEVFDRIIGLDPDLAEGWNKRATVHYLMGDLERSIADIRRVVELEPRHFGAFSGLGLIYLAEGNDRAALRAFQRTLEIHPFYGDISSKVRYLKAKIKGRPI